MHDNRQVGRRDFYVLVDRSASMGHLASTVVSEINRLIDTTKVEAPDTELTVVLFDSEDPFDLVIDGVRVDQVRELTAEDYRAGGGTPLYDALDATIGRATRRAAARGGRGAETVIAVLTDGEENASVWTSALELAGRVRRRKAAGWQFLYLGVGDPFRDASRIGFDPADVQPWQADELGTRAAFQTMTATVLGHGRPAVRRPRPRVHRR